MPVQMIELEEVQTLNIDDDKLAEIVTKSKAQYGSTADEYVEGCQQQDQRNGRIRWAIFIYWCFEAQDYPCDRRDSYMKLSSNQ